MDGRERVVCPMVHQLIFCKKPQTVEHVFRECWDPVFHWDILQRTLKKEFFWTMHGIRFLSVENDAGIPYDMFMILTLHSIWKTRMAVRHADVGVREVRDNFIESVTYIPDMYQAQLEPPNWMPVLDELVQLKRF